MTNPRFRSLRKRSRSVVYGIGITRVVFLFPPLLDFSLVDSRTFEAGIKDKERRRKHGANRLYEESFLAFFSSNVVAVEPPKPRWDRVSPPSLLPSPFPFVVAFSRSLALPPSSYTL